jgi:YbbR domain-containing protein
MRNLGLQLVSLFLAVVVWFVVSAPRRERVSERAFNAPLSLVGMKRELVITTPVPESVSVRLRGRKSAFASVSSLTLEVPVDLSWVQQPGEATITLRPQALNVPPDIEVVSVDPNKFRFRVEALRQRTVPIRPFLMGQVPPGYILGEATVVPERALVSGPETQVMAMSEASTERINLTGRTATFVQNVAIVSDSQLVRVVAPLTTQVSVPVLAEIGPNPPPETGTTP